MTQDEHKRAEVRQRKYQELSNDIREYEKRLDSIASLRTENLKDDRLHFWFSSGYQNGTSVPIPKETRQIVLTIIEAHIKDSLVRSKKERDKL